MKKELKQLSILNEEKWEVWTSINKFLKSYFEIKNKMVPPDDFLSEMNSKIDILFIDSEFAKNFYFDFYLNFKRNEPNFLCVVVKNKPEDNDYKIFKNLTDDIVYLNDIALAKWKVMAIIRRYWEVYSKPSTELYKNLIVDFLDNKVYVDSNEVKLTTKEFEMLKFFIQNKGSFFSKKKLFQKIWGIEDDDTTGVVDQILFKLKRKIGSDFFITSRHKGVMFS